MEILVTGASGFLGKHLTPKLIKRGDKLTKLNSENCDLTKQGELEKKFSEKKFDQIFHLAAYTRPGSYCLEHPGEQWILNQKIDTNVLDWWKNFQPKAKIIGFGSSCSYDPEFPLKEENYLKGEPTNNFLAYGNSKKMLYVGLKCLNKEFGLDYIFFVPSVLYGPDYHTDKRQLHFIYDLAKKILRGKENKEEVVLWGDGEQQRELIYIDDFVDNIIKINDIQKNDIFNIGSGKGESIKKFAKIICERVGYDFNLVKFDVTKPSGAKSKYLDIEKMKEITPNYSDRDYKEGINKMIEWMIKNKSVFTKD
jgi:GDP-L-fucose synthase